MLKKILFCCFVSIILCFSCAEKHNTNPALSENQMIEILADCYLMESSVRDIDKPLDISHITDYYQEIFKKHGVTEEQFVQSYNYYCHDLEKVDKIYEKVLEKLYI